LARELKAEKYGSGLGVFVWSFVWIGTIYAYDKASWQNKRE